MKLDDIRNIIKTDKYDFLRTDPNLKDRIIILGLGGSHAYGTNTETSDLDIRGCTLNSKEEILTNKNFEQFTNEETDTVIYSFNKLITLLSNVNPNTIEILGLKPEHYLYISPVGQELLNNKKLFLSKKCVHSFGGYANQQLYRANQLSAHEMGQKQLEEHILKTLEFMQADFKQKFSNISEDSLRLYIDKSEQPEMDTEIYMDVKLTHYPLRDYCGMWNTLQNTVRSYKKIGKRNEKAVEHEKLGKHLMHLVRLYLMCFDILEKEEIITYREKEHEFLMSIRNGKYIKNDNQICPEFFEIINDYEKRLAYDKKNTNLPDKPNYEKIKDFTISVNERVINNKINI